MRVSTAAPKNVVTVIVVGVKLLVIIKSTSEGSAFFMTGIAVFFRLAGLLNLQTGLN